jgi:hypothetical protein
MKTIGKLVLVLCMVVICLGNAHASPLAIIFPSNFEVFDADNNFIGLLQQNGENLKVYNIDIGMFISFDAYGKLMTPKVPIFFFRPSCSISSGAWVPLSMDWGLETQFNVYRFLSDQSVSFVPIQFLNTQPTLGSCAVPTLVPANPASAPTYEVKCLPASECPTPTATDTFIRLGIQVIQLPFNTPLNQPLHFGPGFIL